MDNNDKGDSGDELSIGAMLGIILGVCAVVIFLVVLLVCLARRNKTQRGSKIFMGITDIRDKNENTFNLSYRQGDPQDIRPASGVSNASYQFDANALRSRENTGRISYDTPYSTIQKPEADHAEVHTRQNANSLDRRQTTNSPDRRHIVAGYGMVSMISPGYTSEYERPDSNQYVSPQDPAHNGFIVKGQGQAGRLTAHSQFEPNVQMRHAEPSKRHEQYPDSFRSSMGVDLGANIERDADNLDAVASVITYADKLDADDTPGNGNAYESKGEKN